MANATIIIRSFLYTLMDLNLTSRWKWPWPLLYNSPSPGPNFWCSLMWQCFFLNGLESKLLHLSNINIGPTAFPPANKITIELSVLRFFFRYKSNYSSIVGTSCYGSLQYRVQSLRCSSGREKERLWTQGTYRVLHTVVNWWDSLLVHVARGQSTSTLHFLPYHSWIRGP